MDLSGFVSVDEPVFIQFRHPDSKELLFVLNADGKPDKSKPIGVEVFGPDTDRFLVAKRAEIARAGADAKHDAKKNIDTDVKMPEYIERANITLQSKMIVRFVNVILDGKELTAPDDVELFRRKLPIIFDQIGEALNDRSRFTKAALISSL